MQINFEVVEIDGIEFVRIAQEQPRPSLMKRIKKALNKVLDVLDPPMFHHQRCEEA